MVTEFYETAGNGKKRIVDDEFIDSPDFEFLQKFSSEIDEIRISNSNHLEHCLDIISAAVGGLSCSRLKPASVQGDS